MTENLRRVLKGRFLASRMWSFKVKCVGHGFVAKMERTKIKPKVAWEEMKRLDVND